MFFLLAGFSVPRNAPAGPYFGGFHFVRNLAFPNFFLLRFPRPYCPIPSSKSPPQMGRIQCFFFVQRPFNPIFRACHKGRFFFFFFCVLGGLLIDLITCFPPSLHQFSPDNPFLAENSHDAGFPSSLSTDSEPSNRF